jgi:DNA-binding transcriptional ArsR family regulator/uncharacterized protein YndB with AHSA1/START domain
VDPSDDRPSASPGAAPGEGPAEDVFRALADRSRRRLLDRLNARDGQTLRELCAGLDMARQSVSKHLGVLEAAGLVVTVRRGREKLHYVNASPINEIADRWISRYHRPRVEALADLRRAVEEPSMSRPAFVYTTYINTTDEQLWRALTEPAFTERYWRTTFASSWERGATVTWRIGDITIADPDQVVLEASPYRRLAYTWHTMTPELSAAIGLSDELGAAVAAERRSRVTFEIEPLGELCKLTVIHDDLEPDSVIADMVSEGWPRVISELKTLLETGEPLPASTERRVSAIVAERRSPGGAGA